MFLFFDRIRLRTDAILAYRWREDEVTYSKGLFKKERKLVYRIEMYPAFSNHQIEDQEYVEEFEDLELGRQRLKEIRQLCSDFVLIDEYYVNPRAILGYRLNEMRNLSTLHFYTTLGEMVYFTEEYDTVSEGLQRYRELSVWMPDFISFGDICLNKELILSYELRNTGEAYALSVYTGVPSLSVWEETFPSRLQAEDRLKALEDQL